MDSQDTVSIDTAKTVVCDTSVKNDLSYDQHTFLCIIITLKSIQSRHVLLSESFEIIYGTMGLLNCDIGKVADAVIIKVDIDISKTLYLRNRKKLLL